MIRNYLYRIGLCLLLCNISTNLHARDVITGKVILSSNLIKAIDGKSFGIHGAMLHALLKIRTRILRMLHGVAQGQTREGLYTFGGQNYTVNELCTLESDHTDKKKLRSWLVTVKQDFSTQIRPFVDLGRGFKPQMLIFIEESLKLHQRGNANSILLKWAETKDGEDMTAFNEYVRSFNDLAQFLHDLLNFLDDLVSSCPKAKQQFIGNLKTETEKQMYAQRFEKLFEQQKKKINALYTH